jgi:hypothetical protein
MLEKRYRCIGGGREPYRILDARHPERGTLFTIAGWSGPLAAELLRNLNHPAASRVEGRRAKEVNSTPAA